MSFGTRDDNPSSSSRTFPLLVPLFPSFFLSFLFFFFLFFCNRHRTVTSIRISVIYDAGSVCSFDVVVVIAAAWNSQGQMDRKVLTNGVVRGIARKGNRCSEITLPMHGLALLFKHPRLESIYREESRSMGTRHSGGEFLDGGREKVSENDNDKGERRASRASREGKNWL